MSNINFFLLGDSTEVAMKAIFEETERLQKQKQAVAKVSFGDEGCMVGM